jgi:TolA-binding protein
MNHDPQAYSGICVARLVLAAVIVLSFAVTTPRMWAQSASPQSRLTAQSAQPQAGAASQPAAQHAQATPDSDLAQMRIDLDRMESLLGNMSSEIEFLRDQNLQILLRTNAQIWTLLIRDLRRQVDREEQRSRR